MIGQHYEITINAPVSKVWDTMLNDASYRQWTAPFNPAGSRYEGSRSEGSTIRFLGPNPEKPGETGGMLSMIAANKLHEFISIKHMGEIHNGVEDSSAPRSGALENYTFSEQDGVTTVQVDIDITQDFKDFMDQAWPKALLILKGMCE